jgi:serine/threonine-protein kinase
MEWIDGRTLDADRKARGRYSLGEALRVIDPVCSALAVAHAVGVVHRDLKPTNIMLAGHDDSLRVVVVDFGIAKLLGTASKGYTSTGDRLGSPHIMAPEQIRGQVVDVRTDVYAVGVLSYLLVTGQLPFSAPSAVEIEEMHLFTPPPWAGDIAPVPARVSAILQRSLAKSPADRYGGVAEFVTAFRAAVVDAEPSLGGRPPRSSEPDSVLERAVGIYVAIELRDPDSAIDDALFDAEGPDTII